ncbi:unnamed protein product, partial [Closterium sp. NIES-53]
FPVLRLHSDRGREFSSALLGAFCRAQGIRQTFTLPASPQQNGIAERRIGMYAAHQLNLQPQVSLPETSPTLLWTGKVGDVSAFRVWGSRAFVRDLSADKLSPRATPCVFLGFPPDAPGWQFYHPTSRRVLSSQDITFDESLPYYHLFPYRTAPLPPPPLFLAPGPPPVDPLPPQGPAPSDVSQVDAVEPVEVAVDSGAAPGAAPGTEPAGARSGGAETGGAEPGGAETGVSTSTPVSCSPIWRCFVSASAPTSVVLTGHADASWADDQATQRSSQGYTFSLGSGSVSWRSTRSSSVLSSSCEAEIYAGAMAAQELRWLTYLLTDLGEQPRSPPVLYVDNKAMLALCQEHRLEHRTKHIALRYFLARELQQRGQLRLAYVASQANTADIFTKALASACFPLLDWSCDLLFSPTLPMRCDRADGLSLFDLTSGFSPAPPTTADSTVRSQWATRDAAARLAVLADLITHLRTSDTRYRAALPAEFCAKNPPPLYLTLYYVVTRLPDSLRVVRDHFLSVCPTTLTVDLLEERLLAAEQSIVAVGAFRGDPRTPIFEGCSPSPLLPSVASAAAADLGGFESVGAASAPSGSHRTGRSKGGRGARGAAQPSRTAPPSRAAPPPLSRTALPSSTAATASTTAATAATLATAPTAAMASPTVLTFDAEGRAVNFDVWVDNLQLFLQCDSRDGVSLFDHTSGVSTAPAATADSTVCSQWTTRDAVARLAVRIARYSSPATAALSRLMLPYLFPDLAAFATVADLVAHLRTSDARYRAALPTEFCAKNPPPMYITLYYLVTHLPDSLSSVRDHFLSLCPTELTVVLLEERLATAEKSILTLGASRGDRRTPFFEGCSLVALLPSVASAAAVDLVGTEEVGAASAPSGRRHNTKGNGSKGGGGGGAGSSGGGGGGGGGGSGGGGGTGSGGVSGGGGGRGGGGGGGGGSGSGGGGGGGGGAVRGTATQRGGFGGSQCQQQLRTSDTLSVQQLREWYAERGRSGSAGPCTYFLRTGTRSGENVPIFDLDFDAILAAMYALADSAEGDCYPSVPPNPGIAAAALGASAAAALGASASTAPGTGASAAPGAGASTLSGTAPFESLHTFTLESDASCSFFRDSTTLTPLSWPVAVSLADPSGGPVLAHSSTVLSCPAAPLGLLSGLHLPSFSTNLVSGADLQDAWVDQFTPRGQRVTHCTCSRMGRHLATFTRRPGSSLYTLTTASPPVTASGQVAASSQVFTAVSRSSPASAPCSCRPLSHETLLWHHRLGHPSLPRLRGMAFHALVSGLPRSVPPLPPGPAPTCVPCFEGRQRAAPHSSSFPPTEAPLQTLHMDVWGPARVRGQGHERYFLMVVDDYSRYTTVFPWRSKGEVSEVLIDWIRGARRQLSESFNSDLLVLRLHSDRGGEFSSDLLRAFCCSEGIRQTFMLPASPQQNGIAECRIGMVMDVAHTSMIHAAAPHFLWPFAVQYAAHQINLQPRVSLPETTPTLRWTGKVGDASAFRVWGSRAFVRDTTADKLLSRAVPCVFLGFPPDAPGWQFSSVDQNCQLLSSSSLVDRCSLVRSTDSFVDLLVELSLLVDGPSVAQTRSSLYTLSTESPPVTASGQAAASSQVFAAASRSGPESAPCSCRLLSHLTLLWHHRLGHPSLPRLRGMASCVLVFGLPRSLPPLPPGPAPTCVPCVEGRQRAAPHSSEFPPTEAPLHTLHMDVWGPARVRGQGHERYFLLVVDDYSRYTTVFPLRSKGDVTEVLIDWIRAARLQLRESFGSDFPVLRLHSDKGGEFSSARLGAFCRAQSIRQTFTLPASPQQNGIVERRIGMVMDVARTSMIHAAAPHFLWPFAVQYAAHQLNLQPWVSLPETSPTLRWTGKVGDASAFRVWGSLAFVRNLSADKLSPRAVPCVFLGFPPDAPGWQFYHPTSRRVLSSQDVTFDKSVSYYRLFPYRTAPLPPPPLFLALGPPTVDPLPPQGPAPSGVSQVDAVEPVEVTVDSGAARGAEPVGAGSGGAESGGAEPGGAESGGAEPGGAEPGGAESGGAEPGGAEPGGAESSHVASRSAFRAAGVGGPPVAPGPGGARTGGTGAVGTGGAAAAAGVGPARASGAAGGVGAGVGVAGASGAAGAGAARGVGAGVGPAGGTAGAAGGSGAAGPAGVGAVGAGSAAGTGAATCGTGAVPVGSRGPARPRLYFVPLLEQVLGLPPSPGPAPPLECPQPVQSQSSLQPVSPLPAPSPYAGPTGGLAERREPASCPALPVRTTRTSHRAPRPRPPAVPGTHQMTLRPSTAPLRVPLPSPPESSLPVLADLESDSLRAASPTVAHYATRLITEFESVCPLSVGGECALSTDVLEDRQEEFQCFAAALPHLVSTLTAPEGDLDAPDIPTPRSYAEAIEGPYSSQWQSAMDAEMASWKSTGTYVDEVPPPGANIVSGMWIFRGVNYFQTFSPTPTYFQSALGFAHSTADPSLFLRTDTSLPPFYILVYVLQRFGFTYSSPEATPLSTRHSLSALPSDESVELSGPYPELVGCLMYLMTCTRPDFAYLLSILACYVAPGRHRPEHMAETKRVLRYLCSTSGLGLVLGGRRPVVLTGHAVASWADDLDTQRSSQGYTFSLGSVSVSWRSTCSSSVLGSSCEAEIYAGAMAALELRWLTYLLTDLGEPPPILYVDNKAMLALCREHRLKHRTKHIALRYFLARELQQRGQLRLAYVAFEANIADIFTKALPPGDHKRFCTMLACFALLGWSCFPTCTQPIC